MQLPDTKWVTGVGSRKTPVTMQPPITAIVRLLASRDHGIRSGAADRADTMFEEAALQCEARLQVFTTGHRHRRPHHTPLLTLPVQVQEEAARIAQAHHRGWHGMSEWARALHTRNVLQVLGPSLTAPSKALICWAPGSVLDAKGRLRNVAGGTGQAVRIAYTYGVPAYNLAIRAHVDKLARLLGHELIEQTWEFLP